MLYSYISLSINLRLYSGIHPFHRYKPPRWKGFRPIETVEDAARDHTVEGGEGALKPADLVQVRVGVYTLQM